jgi:hypothetical protein
MVYEEQISMYCRKEGIVIFRAAEVRLEDPCTYRKDGEHGR